MTEESNIERIVRTHGPLKRNSTTLAAMLMADCMRTSRHTPKNTTWNGSRPRAAEAERDGLIQRRRQRVELAPGAGSGRRPRAGRPSSFWPSASRVVPSEMASCCSWSALRSNCGPTPISGWRPNIVRPVRLVPTSRKVPAESLARIDA